MAGPRTVAGGMAGELAHACQLTRTRAIGDLRSMPPDEFEHLVISVYSAHGWLASLTQWGAMAAPTPSCCADGERVLVQRGRPEYAIKGPRADVVAGQRIRRRR